MVHPCHVTGKAVCCKILDERGVQMLTIKDLLVKHLEYTFVEGWQPSLWMAVQGLTAEQAAWKSSPERHSIWQIIRHVLLWKRSVLQAWAGDLPSSAVLSEADWKEVSGTRAEWEADLFSTLGHP